MNSPIFNPFSQIEAEPKETKPGVGSEAAASISQSSTHVSTSNVNENVVVGQCGRCGNQMVKAGLVTPVDTVYFCETCRVTTPMTDEECTAADRARLSFK